MPFCTIHLFYSQHKSAIWMSKNQSKNYGSVWKFDNIHRCKPSPNDVCHPRIIIKKTRKKTSSILLFSDNHKFIMCARFLLSLTLSTFHPPSWHFFVDVVSMFIFSFNSGFFSLGWWEKHDVRACLYLCSFAMLVFMKNIRGKNLTRLLESFNFPQKERKKSFSRMT